MSHASFDPSFPVFIKSVPQKLFGPTGIAVLASVGIHGLLGVSLPYLSNASREKPKPIRNVQLTDLSPTEQSRLPELAPSPSLPNQSKSLSPLPPSISSLPSASSKNLSPGNLPPISSLLPPGSAALTPRTPSLSDLQKPSKFNSYKIDTRFKLPKLPSAINEPTGTKQSKLPSAINEPTGTKQPKLPSVINEPIGTRQSNNSRTSIPSTRIEQFPQRQVPRNPPLTQLPPVKPSSLRSFEGDSIPPLVNNPNLGLGQPSLPIQMPGPLPPPPPEFPISSNTPRLQPLAQPSTTTPTTLAMGTSSSVATAPPPTTTPRTAPTGTSSPVVTAAPQINVRDNTDNSSASVYNPYNKQITQWLTAQNLTNTDLETVRRLPPMYGNCPPQACSAGVKNEVVVAVRVDDKGKIISDDVLGSSDSGKFDAEAHSTI